MYKTQIEFAIAMSVLLFEMRIESDTPYGDNDNPVPDDFAEKIIDDPDHIVRIKERIKNSIMEHLEHSPDDYAVRDDHHPTKKYYSYCTDVYDHAFAIDAYVQDLYDDTLTKCVYLCMHCGSDAVQVKSWTRPNEGHKFVDEVEGDELGWCDDCQQTVDIQTAELKKRAEVVGYQVVGQDSSPVEGEIHPHMDASFCLYSLDQARSMLDDDNLGDERGYWRLLTIWTGDVEEPTIMYEGDPRA